MSQPMTDDEIRGFMATGSRTGKLATVSSDGSPHVVPVWFDFDDNGDLVFLTREASVKARNMQQEPRVSILVDDENFPFAWAKLDGVATVDGDPDRLVYWATETCRRYVGDALADDYGRRNGVPGELVIRVTPTRMRGERGVAL